MEQVSFVVASKHTKFLSIPKPNNPPNISGLNLVKFIFRAIVLIPLSLVYSIHSYYFLYISRDSRISAVYILVSVDFSATSSASFSINKMSLIQVGASDANKGI